MSMGNGNMFKREVFYQLAHPITHGDAYDEGIEAAQQHHPFDSNPYSAPHLAAAWEDGYLLGLRELRGRSMDTIRTL